MAPAESAPAGEASREPEQPQLRAEPSVAEPPTRTAEPRSTAPEAAPGAVETAPTPQEEAPLPVIFDRLRAVAQEENRGLYAVLDDGQLLERGKGRLRIALPSGFGARRLGTRLADLEAICARLFGHPVRVELETPDGGTATPAAQSAGPPPDSDLARKRKADALKHPGVNEALDILGGEILDIRPLGGPSGEDRRGNP